MHMDRVFRNIKSEIVLRAMDASRPGTSTRKPETEATIVVIPTIFGLPDGRPSEFTPPQMITVSSKRPRSFRSLTNAALA